MISQKRLIESPLTPSVDISPDAPTVCSEVRKRAMAPMMPNTMICGSVIQCQSSMGRLRDDSMHSAVPTSATPPASSQPSQVVLHHTIRPCTRKPHSSATPPANSTKLSASSGVSDPCSVLPGGRGRATTQATQMAASAS